MRLTHWIAAIAFFVAMTGCATASGPKFTETSIQEHSDTALIVAYRSHGLAGAAYKLKLFLNNEAVFQLPTKSYSYVRVRPGNYELCNTADKVKYSLTKCAILATEAGKSYFIAFDTGNMSFIPETLKQVPRDVAMDFLTRGYGYEPALPTSASQN